MDKEIINKATDMLATNNLKRAAVVVVINPDGKILAVQRRNSNKYGLPGGKLEETEFAQAAAIRETEEETGFKIFNLSLLGQEIDSDNFLTTVYLAEVLSFDPSKKKDGESAHFWIDPAELYSFETGAYPVFNEKYVTLALINWNEIAAGYCYRLKNSAQTIEISTLLGHLDYGRSDILNEESTWYLVKSVWSKIPFVLEKEQILAMEPIRISYYDWKLDLEASENCRGFIGTNPTGWNMVSAAMAYAFERHNLVNQRYGKKYLYTKHLKDVAWAALHFGTLLELTEDEICYMIALAYLHDVIEDCGVTYNDVKKALNERLANLAFALSNDKGKTREERAGFKYYTGIINEPGAKFGKLCDRYANVKQDGSMKAKYKQEFEGFANKLRHKGEYDILWDAIETLLN